MTVGCGACCRVDRRLYRADRILEMKFRPAMQCEEQARWTVQLLEHVPPCRPHGFAQGFVGGQMAIDKTAEAGGSLVGNACFRAQDGSLSGAEKPPYQRLFVCQAH